MQNHVRCSQLPEKIYQADAQKNARREDEMTRHSMKKISKDCMLNSEIW